MTMQEAFAEFVKKHIAGTEACAAVGFNDINTQRISILSVGHYDMLGDMAVGVIDHCQAGLFTKINADAGRYRKLRDSANMFVSVRTSSGDWVRVTDPDQLDVILDARPL